MDPLLHDRYGNVLLYVLNSRGRAWSDEKAWSDETNDVHALEQLNASISTTRLAERVSFGMSRTSTRLSEDERRTETNLSENGARPYFYARA